jgi:hypothetical protein
MSDEQNEERREEQSAEEERDREPEVEDLDVPDTEREDVRGGKTPSPGGPVPTPYPN